MARLTLIDQGVTLLPAVDGIGISAFHVMSELTRDYEADVRERVAAGVVIEFAEDNAYLRYMRSGGAR
jgi:hypothetical protein